MKVPIGTRVSFEGDNIPAIVYRTGRTTRMDSHRLEQARGLAPLTYEARRPLHGRSADHRRRPSMGSRRRRFDASRSAGP